MIATLAQLFRRENGATAIEYSLVIALLAFGAIGALQFVGAHLK
jgi:Flp pilus assembly pilin Flp